MNPKPEVISTDQMPHIEPDNLERGDTIYIDDGRQMTLIRIITGDTWLAQELIEVDDFHLGEYLSR